MSEFCRLNEVVRLITDFLPVYQPFTTSIDIQISNY